MTVDAVIPTTGRHSLSTALASVRRQTRRPARTIVVLDVPAAASRVRSLLQDETLLVTDGLGGGGARQAGVRASTNRFVAFLDDDDEWDSNKLARQVGAMEEAGASWSLTGAIFRTSKEDRVVPRTPWDPSTPLIDYALDRSSLRYGKSFVQSSTLIAERTALIETGWDTQLPRHQDWDLVARLSEKNYPFLFLNEPLATVLQGSAGSVSKAADWRQSAAWLCDRGARATARARADFAASVVLRSALRAGDVRGFQWVLGYLRRSGARPHVAAMIVGLSGALSRARENTRVWLP